MRTIIIILSTVIALSLNVNAEDHKQNDLLTTVVTISARYGEDYQITGHTYQQFAEIKKAIKTINGLKENKHKFGIDAYNAMFSTVMSGLEQQGITVKPTI